MKIIRVSYCGDCPFMEDEYDLESMEHMNYCSSWAWLSRTIGPMLEVEKSRILPDWCPLEDEKTTVDCVCPECECEFYEFID